MSTTSRSPKTLHGVAECIVALPYQLGYRPESSLVLVCLAQMEGAGTSVGRGAVALTARVDLPLFGHEEEAVEAMLPALRRSETHGVIAITFDDELGMASTQLLTRVAQAARDQHVHVCALALVCGDHWLSLPVEDPTGLVACGVHAHQQGAPCSLCGWLPLPATEDVSAVASYVLAGRSPLRDRKGLAELCQRSEGDLATATATETARLHDEANHHELTSAVIATASATLGLVVRSQGGALPIGLRSGDLACCAVALEHVPFRDALMEALAPGLLAPIDVPRPLRSKVRSQLCAPCPDRTGVPIRLAALAGHLPPNAATALLSVVGYLAWCRGEGALANVAIETALSNDPFYPLACLVDRALGAAIRPPGAVSPGQG